MCFFLLDIRWKYWTFFLHSEGYVRLQQQIPPGENTWHNKLKRMKCRGCSWQGKHSSCTCAGCQGWIPAPLGEWLLLPWDSCSHRGSNPGTISSAASNPVLMRQLEPIMTLFWKLILSEVISSILSLYAKHTDMTVLTKWGSISSSSFTHPPCLHPLQAFLPCTGGYNNKE